MLQADHEVVIYDNFSNSHKEAIRRVEQITTKRVHLVEADIRDEPALKSAIKNYNCQAVIHFAALKAVGESVQIPLDYYDNNVQGTLCLLRALAAKGLRAKRRDGELQFQQPCPAHDGNCCRIYAERPQRCRAFACRQLEGVFNGEILESAAMEKILEAKCRNNRVRELLEMLGDDRKTRPLATRCAGVFTPPLDPSPHAEALRAELQGALTALEEILAKDFRTGQAG